MRTQQLRNILIDRISGIDDPNLLQAMKVILDNTTVPTKLYSLNISEKLKVEEGLEQIRTGKIISNEDLDKEEDKWLNE